MLTIVGIDFVMLVDTEFDWLVSCLVASCCKQWLMVTMRFRRLVVLIAQMVNWLVVVVDNWWLVNLM